MRNDIVENHLNLDDELIEILAALAEAGISVTVTPIDQLETEEVAA